MIKFSKAAMALAAAGTLVGVSAPASAATTFAPTASSVVTAEAWNHGDRWDRRDDYRRDYDRRYYNDGYGRGDYYRGSSWRGRDGRSYCRRPDGTTGLLVGGVAGALVGREVAGRRGDRTLGAILGAAGGALLGREVDRGGSRCR